MTEVARRRLSIFATATVLLCIGWAIAGLAFRLTGAYASMPVAPGEPYGIADILELIHYSALWVLAGVAGIQGAVLAVLGHFRLRPLSVLMLLFAVGLPVAYSSLHSWAARIAAR